MTLPGAMPTDLGLVARLKRATDRWNAPNAAGAAAAQPNSKTPPPPPPPRPWTPSYAFGSPGVEPLSSFEDADLIFEMIGRGYAVAKMKPDELAEIL